MTANEPAQAPDEADSDVEQGALGALRDHLIRVLSPERAEVAARLAQAAYRRAPDERLHELDPAVIAAKLDSALTFMEGREPGVLALRVFNASATRDGWECPGTVIEVNVEDRPFLVSTISEELARQGLEVADLIHPVVGVERAADGRLIRVLRGRQAQQREAFMHLELAELLSEPRRASLTADLERVLGDAMVATRDFGAMRQRVRQIAAEVRADAGQAYPQDEGEEVAALLEWILDDNFVLLGYREYDVFDHAGRAVLQAHAGSGLGILADEAGSSVAQPTPIDELPAGMRERVQHHGLLVVSRTNRTSTVHRQVRMIYVGVRKYGPSGEMAGEHRILGLFALKGQAQPPGAIPVLRRKLADILEREDIIEHSYDERALRELFEALPKHELFRADAASLRRLLVELLQNEERRDVGVYSRPHADLRGVSVLVALPRERATTSLRRQIGELLIRRLDGVGADEHLSTTDSGMALLHYVVHTDEERSGEVDRTDLATRVRALARSWEDELGIELAHRHGLAEGARLADTHLGRLPPGYTEQTSVETAALDLGEVDLLLSGEDDVRMVLRDRPDEQGLRRFVAYKRGAGMELSAFMPILESLGLQVVEEIPYRLEGRGGIDEVNIHDFGVRLEGDAAEISWDSQRLADAAMAAWQGRTDTDSLNRLVLRAGLGWQDVATLRAYRRYRRQLGTSFTERYQDDALVTHPDLARGLADLFAARFDPEADPAPEHVAAARDRVARQMDLLDRLDDDRILRGFLAVMEATVRTNRYGGRSEALALKIDSSRLPDPPKPVPYAEVFVHGSRIEGIHLRGGPIARGGIRWSDRLEDYRTEVLGLMKSQMMKNALIVPTGAKGGFVLKSPPAGAVAVRAEVRRGYATFVRALLDVTDNVVEGRATSPPGVRRADGDDPYLVVAADRGTADLSDLANEISAEYGFWLGDAFASGGSQGYDHRAMGITARGAWVAVQQHFRELSIDVQQEPIQVVGIGDMSGDVFGSGMLRSDALRLVAAFDHRDIFIDPDPDPAVSFAERARLHDLPGSSWQDYDRALISEGGGVWSRVAKRIPLSKQARRVLRVADEWLSPPDVIRAILRAPVDLLFVGGIGTFVKASSEKNDDVGDRANDALRINADEVSARVVGEGGNLAFTQLARIQYARRGGRINIDAIDNSAGVDTSDREVNLKILLDQGIARGDLASDERVQLLAAMQEEVADRVVRGVYLQTSALRQEVAASAEMMPACEALIEVLESSGQIDRGVEMLPSASQMETRRQAGAGLTRPELAVLLCAAKTDLAARLLDSDLPEDPYLARTLRGYFPQMAAERLSSLLGEHRLRRELVATIVANDTVNRMGITYASRTASELGATRVDVVRAYWVARDVAGADQLWRGIEALDDTVDPVVQDELAASVDAMIDAFTRIYLRRGEIVDVAGAVQRDRPAFEEMEKSLAEGGSGRRWSARRAAAERLAGIGVRVNLAEQLAALEELGLAPDVAAVARSSGESVRHVTEVFLRLDEALPLNLLHSRLDRLAPTGHWQRWQHRGLVDELRDIRRTAAEQALAASPGPTAADAVDEFLSSRAGARERLDTVARLIERESEPDLAAVAVAVRALRDLISA